MKGQEMNEHHTKTEVRLTEGTQDVGGHNQPHVPGPLGTREGGPTERLRDRATDAGVPAQQVAGSPTVPASQATGGGINPTSPLAQMHSLINRAGEEQFSEQTIQALMVPIDDSLVDVRPDGLIYVNHTHYRTALDRAFGVGGWTLVPLAQPRIDGNRVYYYGFLKAQGRFISDAVGEATYSPNSKRSTYGNSVESAKSDCLVRCCKALPMFRQCWDKDYADYWLATYAEGHGTPGSESAQYRKKEEFRRKDFAPEARQLGPDRKLLLTRNDEYNDNADYYNDGRED